MDQTLVTAPRIGDVCRMRPGFEGNFGAKMFIIKDIVYDGTATNYLYEVNGKVHGAFASWLEVVERGNPGADPPTRITSTPSAADVERVVQRAVEKVIERAGPPRRHNATCPRCYGPAFHGFGYAPTCEREGGCLADKEPRVFAHPASLDVRHPDADVLEVPADDGPFSTAERGWWALSLGPSALFATRDQAVAAWREAMLERAKRDAGR